MIRTPGLAVGAVSHVGLVRRENQDRMGHFRVGRTEVFLVADGMGGHRGGALAASMVLEGFQKALSSRPQPRSLRAALRAAAGEVNVAVCAVATSGDPATEHMGSTAVLLAVRGREVLIGHLGDSRAYLWRDGRLVRLTRDHTWVQQLMDQKLLTEEEARHHPEASVLAHAFGRQSELPIALSPGLAVRSGDAILLCSDGLSGYLEDDEIAAVISRHEDPQRVAEALVEAALAVGGHDNVTVQFVVFTEPPRWHSRRILGRDGVRRPVKTPAISPPPPSPAPALQEAAPETTGVGESAPTQPALPLPPPAVPATHALPSPRRRRAASGVMVLATLAGAAVLVFALRSLLRETTPAKQPKLPPTPATPVTPLPPPSLPGEEPAAAPEPSPTPTPPSTPVRSEVGESPAAGEVP